MDDRRYGALPYREETDWLLVKYLKWEGKRGSLGRLWKAQECAQMATELNTVEGIRVWSVPHDDVVAVYCESMGHRVHGYVSRVYPYVGLQGAYEMLCSYCRKNGL